MPQAAVAWAFDEARLLGDRDEVPQVPQFDVHPERNPNRRASTGIVDTIALEGGVKKT
jgi:hypothetical protein